MPSHTVDILTLHFTPQTKEEALLTAHRLADAHQPSCIFTPNAEMAQQASRSPAFSDLLNHADLLLPDGIGIVAAARLQGASLSRVPGIDFAEALLATAPPTGYRLFLFGARPGVAAAAAKALCARFPRVTICGVQNGYFAPDMSNAIAATIRASKPDLIFVCLGSPKQEEWIAVHRLPCLAIGLGGALDVWSGEVRRAPLIVQRAGMEWLWRLLHQPSRLKRLPALASFSARVLISQHHRPFKKCQKEE